MKFGVNTNKRYTILIVAIFVKRRHFLRFCKIMISLRFVMQSPMRAIVTWFTEKINNESISHGSRGKLTHS